MFINELEGLSAIQMDQIWSNRGIEFDKEFQKDKYVSLSFINESEYNRYKKIVTVSYANNEYHSKDALYIPFGDIWDKLNSEKEQIETYLEKFNITKNDKLLIICYGGGSSQIISYFLCKKGYNAYYGSYNTLNDENFIDFDILKESIKEKSIIVDSLNYNLDEKYYLFLFNIDEKHLICNFPSLIGEEGLKKNIYGIRGTNLSEIKMKEVHPNIEIADIKEIDLQKSKIICLTPLHCLLTKHKIFELNLEVKKIYCPDILDN